MGFPHKDYDPEKDPFNYINTEVSEIYIRDNFKTHFPWSEDEDEFAEIMEKGIQRE